MIANLRRDNEALREIERKRVVLEAQLLELRHQLRVLQEEKARAEVALLRREPPYPSPTALEYTIQRDRRTLAEKEAELRDAEAELLAYKKLVQDKSVELADLNRSLASYSHESVLLRTEKRVVESGLAPVLESKSEAQARIDHWTALNSRLILTEAETNAKEREKALEAARLRTRLREVEELTTIQRRRARELALAGPGWTGSPGKTREHERLLDVNLSLQVEKRVLSRKEIELELELRKARLKLDDALQLIEAKERDIKNAARYDVQKLERENESLRFLLDQYRNDVEVQKRLRNDEIYQKLEIEREKKRVENEALEKELEARRAKRELAQYQDTHGLLLEEKSQLHDELRTLQDHAGLLESQNASVRPSPHLLVAQ